MKLTEALNTVIPYKWYDDGENVEDVRQANFKIGNLEYIVLFTFIEATDDLPDRWDVEFGLLPAKNDPDQRTKYGFTNTGNQFAVMSTVTAISKEWFKYHPTNCVTATADTISRQKLYIRLLTNSLPNWKIITRGNVVIAER